MAKLYITLQELKDNHACAKGMRKLLRSIDIEDSEEVRIPIELILETNGPYDADWAIEELSYMDPQIGPGPLTGSYKIEAEFGARSELSCWDDDFDDALMADSVAGPAYRKLVADHIKGCKR